MKSSISDPMHPGAASLLYRSGAAQRYRQRFPEPARFVELRGNARRLLEAGIIDFDQHDEICRSINRRVAADFLRRLRKAEPFCRRQALIRQLRASVPAGFGSYEIRMGHHLKSRRCDVA